MTDLLIFSILLIVLLVVVTGWFSYFTPIGKSIRHSSARWNIRYQLLNEELDAAKIVQRALEDPVTRARLFDAIAQESERRKKQQK